MTPRKKIQPRELKTPEPEEVFLVYTNHSPYVPYHFFHPPTPYVIYRTMPDALEFAKRFFRSHGIEEGELAVDLFGRRVRMTNKRFSDIAVHILPAYLNA